MKRRNKQDLSSLSAKKFIRLYLSGKLPLPILDASSFFDSCDYADAEIFPSAASTRRMKTAFAKKRKISQLCDGIQRAKRGTRSGSSEVREYNKHRMRKLSNRLIKYQLIKV